MMITGRGNPDDSMMKPSFDSPRNLMMKKKQKELEEEKEEVQIESETQLPTQRTLPPIATNLLQTRLPVIQSEGTTSQEGTFSSQMARVRRQQIAPFTDENDVMDTERQLIPSQSQPASRQITLQSPLKGSISSKVIQHELSKQSTNRSRPMKKATLKFSDNNQDGPCNEDEILSMFLKENEEDEQQQEDKCTKCCNRGIIRNSSKIRFYWDIYIILLVIYNTFSVPFDSAFGNPNNPYLVVRYLDYLIDLCFCIDVSISFRTSYFDQEGEEVLDGKKIARNYIRSGRFFIDFIASVPLDSILRVLIGPQQYLDFVSLIKLVRVSRINRLISLTKLKTEFKISLRIFQLLFFLILIVHLVACFWHLIVRNDLDWMPPKDAIRQETDVHDPTKILSQYSTQLYYAVALLFGTEVAPVTEWQTFYATFILLLGSIVTAAIFGNMTVLFQNLSRKSSRFHEMLDDANTAMKNINIPDHLITKVNDYLMYTYTNLYRQEELNKFFKLLSPSYKYIVTLHLYKDLLKKNNELLKGLDQKVVDSLVRKLKTSTFIPDDEILKQGDLGDSIYFLGRGEVEIYILDRQRQLEFVKVLKPGEYFGEICAILPNVKRTATVKAKNYCTTAVLDKPDFDSLCEVFPILRERFIKQVLGYDDFWKYYISNYLIQIPYLRKLKHIELLQVIYSLKRVHFSQGKEIIKKSDCANYFFLLVHGEIQVNFNFPKKNRSQVHRILQPGAVGFIFSCLDETAQLYTLTAQTDCNIMMMHKHQMMEIAKDNKGFKENIKTITNLLNKDELPLYDDFSKAKNVDHTVIEGTQLTKSLLKQEYEWSNAGMKLRSAILRIMKNVTKVKQSANTRFRLLDVVSKYKNLAQNDEEDLKDQKDDPLDGKKDKKKRKGTMEDSNDDDGMTTEEVYEDYREFKNLILQTSKIVSEQQAKIDQLLIQLQSIPGLKDDQS